MYCRYPLTWSQLSQFISYQCSTQLTVHLCLQGRDPANFLAYPRKTQTANQIPANPFGYDKNVCVFLRFLVFELFSFFQNFPHYPGSALLNHGFFKTPGAGGVVCGVCACIVCVVCLSVCVCVVCSVFISHTTKNVFVTRVHVTPKNQRF